MYNGHASNDFLIFARLQKGETTCSTKYILCTKQEKNPDLEVIGVDNNNKWLRYWVQKEGLQSGKKLQTILEEETNHRCLIITSQLQ